MMNITKKLFFGLLLAASLFATACDDGGDDSNKKQVGADCTASTECDSGKCYDNGTKGVCGKACADAADTSCGDAATKECKEMTEKGGAAATDKVFVCQDKTPTKKADGEDCAKSDECDSGKCYDNGTKGVCGKDCADAADTSCGTAKMCKEMPKKDGAATDKVFVCQDKIANGQPCAKSDECQSGKCYTDGAAGKCGKACASATDTSCSPKTCTEKDEFGVTPAVQIFVCV